MRRSLAFPPAGELDATAFTRVGFVAREEVVLFEWVAPIAPAEMMAIASRLGWPFVEIFPSRLAAESPGGLAAALRETFTALEDLERVLLFIDEVEEIAPVREGKTYSPVHAVTNELLKLLPVSRERDQRLLVCATNSVRTRSPIRARRSPPRWSRTSLPTSRASRASEPAT